MQTSPLQNTKHKLFLIGAGGYVGGTFVTKLLSSSEASNWDVSVLVRSKEAAQVFQKLGLTPILGSLEDNEVLNKAVLDADVTINIADADNLPAIQTIVGAIATGDKRRILIHTSGTAVLVDDAKGEYTSDKIISDLDVDYIHSIPLERIHRGVDSYIFDKLKNQEAIIVAPSTIYGSGTGPLKKHSLQIPFLIRTSIKLKRVATIGKGVNIWNNVHVEDLAAFYLLLLQKAWEGKASTGRDGWYFVENGEETQKAIATEVAKELHKQGAIQKAEVGQFTKEEVDEHFGIMGWLGLATNSRSKAERTRALGWKPSDKRETILESIGKEVESILTEEKAK